MALVGGNIQALTAIQERAGGIEAWAADAKGTIWYLAQSGPGGSLMDWEGPGFREQPVAAARLAAARRNDDASVMLALLDNSGMVSTLWRKPDGSWDPWSGPGVGRQQFSYETIAAAPQGGGAGFQLFASDLDDQIWTLDQGESGEWGEWQGPGFEGQEIGMNRLAPVGARDGGVTLCARDTRESIWAIGRSAPGKWGRWTGPGIGGAGEFFHIAAAELGGGGGGGVQLFALDLKGQVSAVREDTPGGGWGSWEGPGFQSQPVRFLHIAAAAQDNGNIMVLAGDEHGSLWTISENEPNSENWGNWTQSPGPGDQRS
ncbi:MAG TPA: hypothetical protein VES64_00130 [Allosphingosinicella sp.]|nr:hypothetical protein [Allosphingosinicella sp.]